MAARIEIDHAVSAERFGKVRLDRDIPAGSPGGLPAETGSDPVILILGSYPGPRSLAAREYYAHPHNQFWRIMEALFQIDHLLPYPERVARLSGHRIALWDVIRSCRRKGASDSAIRDVIQNDIRQFLESHPQIRFIGANGNTAGRYLVSGMQEGPMFAWVRVVILPSTSPANTRYTFEEKLERWEIIREYLP
ncbi:MAG: DNA-deoxyinosine glycosylase [Methanoregulaceae archaeon]|nr:DNA-deoxyinosine glycosylase [Methanoregulaceae archaeon]